MRRSATAHNPGVSLFPFLAVLICTMGVMMLLLVICNRPGIDGDDKGAGAAAEQADADAAKGVLTWRVAQLKTSRDKTAADLADRRLRLSAVEEHMGQLREEWNSLRLAAKDLELAEHAKGEAVQLTESQLAKLRQQLEQAKGELGKAVERRRTEAPSFAIVPYEGPNGTRRRPIYIECSRDRVTIQPEGVVLTIEDFEGPSGPGNPLATILRATRDFLASQGAAGGAVGEPYPLLLVRPDGIELFYGARAAMESWASEFGYELIEQDRKLVYPAPNPQLARVAQTALADARARYAWFAQTRTARKRAEGERPVYRASTTGGGIVRVDHGSTASGEASGTGSQGSGVGVQGSDQTSRSALAAGGQWSGGGGQGSGVGGQASGVGGQGSIARGQWSDVGNQGSVVGGQGSGVAGQGTGFGGPSSGVEGPPLTGVPASPFANTPWGAAAGSGSRLGSAYGMPSQLGAGAVSPTAATAGVGGSNPSNGILAAGPSSAVGGNTAAPGSVAGGPYNGSAVPGGVSPAPNGTASYPQPPNAAYGQPSDGGMIGAPGVNGGQMGTEAPDSGATAGGDAGVSTNGNGSADNGNGSGAASSMPSGFNVAVNSTPTDRHSVYDDRPPIANARAQQPGPGEFVDSVHYTPPKPKREDNDPAKKPHSLADERGRNWSLPSSAKQSVPVSRPIHIECRGDRLIILPDAGNADPQVVMFSGRTEDSVDKLVTGVWAHTKGWGIAGRQMYWRPSLVLELGPSGEGRFTELQALMANSGLEVIRK